MGTVDLMRLGSTVALAARSVVDAFTTPVDLSAIPITPLQEMQSFNSDRDKKIWFQLLRLSCLTRRSRERDADAFHDLRAELPELESWVGAN
jgi:hypothetical protein